MSDNFKLKKIELIAIVCALVAASVLLGYFIGKGVGPKTVTINVAESNEETSVETAVNAAESESVTVNKNNIIRKININTAGEEELCELPGIGEVLSQRIIAYRKENGNFTKIEDILNVKGIGSSIYESIKDYIFV